MKEKIDFSEVAHVVRMNMLGSIELPLPSEFERLDNEQKSQLYRRIFDLHNDMCCYLSSSLYIDELNKRYVETDSQDSNRNDSTDEW